VTRELEIRPTTKTNSVVETKTPTVRTTTTKYPLNNLHASTV